MCTHCSTKQMEDCLASDFKRVSRADNDVLPRTVLDLMLGNQSAEIVLKFFSKDVGKMMEKFEAEDEGKENAKPRNIHHKVVKSFVRCIRNWYLACDACGYTPIERITMLQEFFDLLTENVDVSSYPPPTTHVKGILIVCYKGLLMNTTTRIYMYSLCKYNIYNHRAFSTVAIENFFSDLQAMEFSGLGCPKATVIHKLMANVMQLTKHRLDPDR